MSLTTMAWLFMITTLFSHSARFTGRLFAVLAELVAERRRHCVVWWASRSSGGGVG